MLSTMFKFQKEISDEHPMDCNMKLFATWGQTLELGKKENYASLI